MKSRCLLLVLVAVGLAGPAHAQNGAARAAKLPRTAAGVPAAIVAEQDIVSKNAGTEKLGLDLYRIQGRRYENAPLAVWIHSGGYLENDRRVCGGEQRRRARPQPLTPKSTPGGRKV